jgi:hypothetical protein
MYLHMISAFEGYGNTYTNQHAYLRDTNTNIYIHFTCTGTKWMVIVRVGTLSLQSILTLSNSSMFIQCLISHEGIRIKIMSSELWPKKKLETKFLETNMFQFRRVIWHWCCCWCWQGTYYCVIDIRFEGCSVHGSWSAYVVIFFVKYICTYVHRICRIQWKVKEGEENIMMLFCFCFCWAGDDQGPGGKRNWKVKA